MSRTKLLPGAALALLLAGCSPASQPGLEPFQPPAQVNYDTCTVERGSYVKSNTASAAVVYPIGAALCTEQDGLRIAELSVSINQEVKEGEVLVRLEREEGGAKLVELTQGLEELKRDYELEKARREREIKDAKWDLKHENYYSFELSIKQLFLQKLESEYDQYLFETERAMRLQEKAIEKQREFSGVLELTAPFDGFVASVTQLSVGELAAKNTPLVAVSSSQDFLIRSDNSTAGLRYQMPVTLEAGPANGRVSFTGHVISAYSLLPDRLGLKEHAYIQIDEPVEEKALQMNLKATGNTVELGNILTAERTALRMDEGKNWVTILSDDMLQKRRILTGPSDVKQFVVLDGLEEGQRLLID